MWRGVINKMKKLAFIAILAITMLLTLALATAATPGEASVSGVSDKGEYNFTTTDTLSVEAGNITYADLDTNMSTYRWAGIFGNVSGNIVLGDSANNQMFTWTAKGRVVYASEAASVTWSSMAAEDGSHVAGYYNGASESDNFTNTFTGTEAVDSGIKAVAAAPTATTLGGTSNWKTYALYDGSAVVFAGNVLVAGDTAYDGSSSVNYQMIVPEDGTAGNTAATAYNLWVELQ